MRDNQYFYTTPSDIHVPEGFLFLRADEAHHCAQVLRKRVGDEFYVVDGVGWEYVVGFDETSKAGIRCRILESSFRPNELPVDITLAQALLKKDHFDLVVEKATELGVSRIIPLRTQRCVMQADDRRVARWNKIAREAMKQSRRCVCPSLASVTDLDEVMGSSGGFDVRVLCHEESRVSWREFCGKLPDWRSAVILVGPEGGFTDDEVRMAGEAGWVNLSLGERRLRAGTAALCAVTLFSNHHSL